MNMDLLGRATDNEDNAHMITLTPETVFKAKLDILTDIGFEKGGDALNAVLKKLDGYVYIDEIHEVRNGTYIRWIDMTKEGEPELVKGGLFCDIRFADDGAVMRCKTFQHRFYELKMDNVILFRKLTPQERVIMCAITYLRT